MTQTAFITGGASRLGYLASKIILSSNYQHLWVHYNKSTNLLPNLKTAAQKMRKKLTPVQFDFNDFNQLIPWINNIYNELTQIDLLILNAAQFFQTPLNSLNPSDWDQLLTVNAKAPFFLANQIIQNNPKNSKCRILFISDIYGKKPLKDFSIYSLTKTLINQMVTILNYEYKDKVIINAISPGSILKANFTKPSPLAKDISPPDSRILAFEEALRFFINAPDYIRGQTLSLNGGN